MRGLRRRRRLQPADERQGRGHRPRGHLVAGLPGGASRLLGRRGIKARLVHVRAAGPGGAGLQARGLARRRVRGPEEAVGVELGLRRRVRRGGGALRRQVAARRRDCNGKTSGAAARVQGGAQLSEIDPLRGRLARRLLRGRPGRAGPRRQRARPRRVPRHPGRPLRRQRRRRRLRDGRRRVRGGPRARLRREERAARARVSA
mmetsp:Transcript_2585/g.7454  ORF Transcript_2585/g.7454 Transcript_2585/m.7454 type:complete len:203 (+) Transcript_2585:532-1140(+)